MFSRQESTQTRSCTYLISDSLSGTLTDMQKDFTRSLLSEKLLGNQGTCCVVTVGLRSLHPRIDERTRKKPSDLSTNAGSWHPSTPSEPS